MVTARFQSRASTPAEDMAFIAEPLPMGEGDRAVASWAKRQFEALQRVLGRAPSGSSIAALEARIAALEAIVGDGTWDGGTP